MGLSLRKLGSRIFDQVNPFDNGRTYQQRTPTNNRSVVQQAVNSGASNVAQGVARNAVRAYPQAVKSVGRVIAPVTPVDDIVRGVGNLSEEVANAVPEISPTSPARFLNSLAIRPYKTTQGNFGQALQGQNPYEGSARQQAGQFTQDVINASSVLPVGKAASLATKGAPLGIKVLQGAKLGAKMGGGFGAAQGVSTSLQDELSIPEALKTTAVNTVAGTALGAGLGVAAPVGGKVISVGAKGALKGAKVSAKATQDAIQAVRATQTPLNEVGGIGKDVRTAKYNNKNVEMVPTDELLKYREHDRTTVYGGSGMSDKQYAELKADIAKNGIKAPLGLSYNAKDRTAYLGEGNHRLAIARELGIKELPVEVQGVMSNSLVGKAVKVSGRAPDEFGYVPSNQRPSDIGVKTSPRLRNPLRPLNEGGYVRLPSGEQVDKPLYHGSPVADQIRQEGFKQAPVRNGNLYGEGTYLTTSRSTAKDYADVGKNVVRADVPKNAKVLRVNSMETQNIDVPTLKKQGYDGIEIADGPQHNNIVMFDPKKITPVKERAKIKKISNLNDNEMNDLTPSVIDYWKNQGFSGVSNGKRTVKFNVANKLGLKKLNEGGFVANPFNKDGSLRSGVKKDQIFDGVDGKPRVEFNDSGAKTNTNNLDALNRPNELAFSRQALNMGVIMKTVDEPTAIKRLGEIDKLISSAKKEATKAKKTTLSNVLEHPELYKQYPELQNMPVEFVKNRNNGLLAGYDPAKDRILINANKVHVGDNYKKSLLHEIQHAIQEREGFAAGGDVRWKDYNNLAGEAEARAVAERINMTPAERAKIPFNNSLDVPKEDLIMRNSDGTAMSIDKTTKPAQSKVPKASQLPKVALKQETAPQAPVPENNLVDSLPNNNTTKKVGEKTRGFQENIQRTLPDQPTAQAVIEAMPGYKPITNKGSLKKASDAIAENPQGEYARIITKNQLDSADDVVSGNLLLRDAIEAGDTETAIQLGTKLGIDGTKLGQAIQAYATFKKTTPEGIITYASKQARSKGNELDAITAKELTDKANAIAAMPESFEKAKLRKEMLQQADELGRSWTDVAGEVLNVPRAAMATADFSAPLRQGAILGSRFPAQFGKAFAESAKYMFKPDYYEKAMYDLTQRPTYSLMKSRKLSVDAGENLTGTEEQFLNNILEADFFKKIGVGHVVAASDRAYSGFLTKIRADVFDKVLADSNKAGVQLGNKELDSLAKYINSASGRGSGNVTNQVSRLQVLFSARLWKSRLDVLNPAYYARLDPTARKYALQSAASFAGIATTLISLAAAGGADVSADPRSADFGKIKVGNTRYDVLSGLQQNIRLAAQLISGEKVNSETGEVQTLGPERGFGKPSRLDILYQFVENKENPAIAFATKALRGTDPTGKPINLASEAAKLTIPLTAQGAYSTVKDTGSVGKGIAMNLPGVFGVGVQTYGDNKTKDKVAGGSSPDDQTPAQGKVAIKKASGDGYGLNRLSDGKYAYKFEGDDKIYTTKNLKDARDALSKDRLAKSGDNIKVVGDTVYRKNSEGKVTEMPKIKYDYQVGTATMTAQKNAGDLDGYVKTAQSQLANIDKQLKDPTTDPLEAAKLRNQATSLQKSISKYSGYGGFAKGKSGGRSRGSRGGGGGSSSPEAESAYKYAIKLKSSGAIPKPKVKAVASKKVKASGKVGKIKVSSKKSLV